MNRRNSTILSLFWNSRIFGNREGLNRAMQVVEKDFAVVGILEDWDKTLAVLEHYIPRYFKGVTKIYDGKTLQRQSCSILPFLCMINKCNNNTESINSYEQRAKDISFFMRVFTSSQSDLKETRS